MHHLANFQQVLIKNTEFIAKTRKCRFFANLWRHKLLTSANWKHMRPIFLFNFFYMMNLHQRAKCQNIWLKNTDFIRRKPIFPNFKAYDVIKWWRNQYCDTWPPKFCFIWFRTWQGIILPIFGTIGQKSKILWRGGPTGPSPSYIWNKNAQPSLIFAKIIFVNFANDSHKFA